jgi:hypothetical protein
MNQVYWESRNSKFRLVDTINGITTGYKKTKIAALADWKRNKKKGIVK